MTNLTFKGISLVAMLDIDCKGARGETRKSVTRLSVR